MMKTKEIEMTLVEIWPKGYADFGGTVTVAWQTDATMQTSSMLSVT